MKEQLKVYSAAILGFSTPAMNWAINIAEPLLKLLLLLGQIGVAGVTILYIVQKWRNARNKNKDE